MQEDDSDDYDAMDETSPDFFDSQGLALNETAAVPSDVQKPSSSHDGQVEGEDLPSQALSVVEPQGEMEGDNLISAPHRVCTYCVFMCTA